MAWQRQFMRAGAVFDFLSRPFMTLHVDARADLGDEVILMAANHRSLLDVFVALISCYRLKRPTRFIVGRVFFKRPGMGAFLRAIGCIEGGRKSGAGAVASEAILGGSSCAIMPEGAIQNTDSQRILGPLLPGVSEIWTQTRCPFVAVGIAGAGLVWPEGRNIPRRPHLRKTRRPVVRVRLTELIQPGDEPCSLERVANIMEDNCEVAEADRVAALVRR